MEGLGSVVYRGVVWSSMVLCGVVPTLRFGEHEGGEWVTEETHLSCVGMSAESQRDISGWHYLSSPMRWIVR